MSDVEAHIRARLDEGEAEEAMALALDAYGPEILGFLLSVNARRVDAEDVFGEACTDLWRGLPGFDGRASFRTWAYAVARNAHHRHLDRHVRRARRNTGLSALDALSARVRTETAPWQKTENKDRLSRLRASLEPDEQMLLVLRLDRDMSWDEVAEVMADDPLHDPAERKRRAAAARKRFERLKDRLRQLALQDGLIREED